MKRGWIHRAAVLALAALASLAALLPVAVRADSTRYYYLELYKYPQGGFPTSGTLSLIFHDSGIVTGYFRPTQGGGVAAVSGAVARNVLQLDFGGTSPIHINGTMKEGTILGRGYRSFGSQLYSFRLLPIPNDHTLPKVTPEPWPNE
jgi:hypothetical protein